MPIHLIWGDDYEASSDEIEKLIQTVIDPVWKSFNHSQIDGNDTKQLLRALEEVQSAPLGGGGRIVLVRRSPFCNGCSIELANKLELRYLETQMIFILIRSPTEEAEEVLCRTAASAPTTLTDGTHVGNTLKY